MGQRLIIKEEEKRSILSLYIKEQGEGIPNSWTETVYFGDETRKAFANLANKKEAELEKLKNSDTKQSQIKYLELNIALLRRNSYEVSSNEWDNYQSLYKSLNSEYQIALENEKQEELKKAQEIKKMKQDELERQRVELEKQREIKTQQLELEKQQLELEKQRKEKLNLPLKKFIGKSVNFYNDVNQQVLYGKDIIKNIEYDDSYKVGGRSGVLIYTEDGLEYEIICLS